jgi:hypothetical protein
MIKQWRIVLAAKSNIAKKSEAIINATHPTISAGTYGY